jgi:hypothetical protein
MWIYHFVKNKQLLEHQNTFYSVTSGGKIFNIYLTTVISFNNA